MFGVTAASPPRINRNLISEAKTPNIAISKNQVVAKNMGNKYVSNV